MLPPFTFMTKGLLLPGSGERVACPVRPGFKEGAAGWDLERSSGLEPGQALH